MIWQESLLEGNYEHFDENEEENKLIYTEIYQEYTTTIEDFIVEQLKERIENFCMKDFLKGNSFVAKKKDLTKKV